MFRPGFVKTCDCARALGFTRVKRGVFWRLNESNAGLSHRRSGSVCVIPVRDQKSMLICYFLDLLLSVFSHNEEEKLIRFNKRSLSAKYNRKKREVSTVSIQT